MAVAKETVDTIATLREPLEDESQLHSWSPAERQQREKEVSEVLLNGRDRLAAQLSSRSFRGLERWIAKAIAPGMTVDLVE